MLKVIALSDKGRVRTANQDAYYVPRPGETFAVVCPSV